ncbi:MAG TPA: hypothetical protein VHN98_09290 [Acidimicrobiales bacterium]|nr:hypothetical protein [Acidimicrobiales bacterium]
MTRDTPWGLKAAIVLLVSAVAFTLVEHVTDWRPRPTRVHADTFGCLFSTTPEADAAAASSRQPGSDAWYRLDHLGTYGTVKNSERRAVRAEIVATAHRKGDGTSATRSTTTSVVVPARSSQEWEVAFPRRSGAADVLFAGLPEEYRCTAKVRSISYADR